MRKSTKIILSIALAMVILGGSLSALAWGLSGGNLGVTWISGVGLRPTQSQGSKDLRKNSVVLDSFTDISLETDYGNVRLLPGDEYRVDYSLPANIPEPEITLENGLLSIRNSAQGKGYFSFLRGPDFTKIPGNDSYFTIYYPKDAVFGDIDMDSELGKLDLRDLTLSGELELSVALGDITLAQVTARQVTLEADMGTIFGDGLTAEFLDAAVAMGDLEIKNARLSGMDAETDMGSLSVEGDLQGDLELSSAMGDVTLRTSAQRGSFYIQADSELGGTEVNGYKLTDGGSPTAPNHIYASCDIGSVKLFFAD